MLARKIATLLMSSVVACTIGLSAPKVAHAEISYEEILQNPNDLRLNLEYARQEVASGRLQQAAAALERLLLRRPNWDAVRLFYGVVLYRLGDLNGSRRELTALEGRGLSSSQEADRKRYLSLVNKKSSKLRISARYSAGVRYDTNPGRVADSRAARTAVGSEEDDFSGSLSSRVRAELDIGNGRGDYLFVQTEGNLREYLEVDRSDFIYSSIKGGAKFHAPGFTVSPYIVHSGAYLQYELLQTTTGGGVDLSVGVTPALSIYLNGYAAYEDYVMTSFSTIGSQRDGWIYSGELGARYRLSDKTTITAYGKYGEKDADAAGFSYDQAGFGLKGFRLLGQGVYISLAGSYTHTDFDAPDGFYSTTTAVEKERYYGRATIGSPLSVLFSQVGIALPEQIGDIVAQAGVTYSHQDSNIPQLNVQNFSTDLIFTKRVEF